MRTHDPPGRRAWLGTGALSDAGAVALAVCTAAGAWLSAPVPLVPAALVGAAALVARRPALLLLGAALVASALGARAWAGLEPPAPAPFSGWVTLVGDPVPAFRGVRVDVSLGAGAGGAGGGRVQLQAVGAPADTPRLVGGRRAGRGGRPARAATGVGA